MIYLEIFWSFLIANLLGYGGGPATIPLIQIEVVNEQDWMTLSEFGDLLAIANALPVQSRRRWQALSDMK